ncbi:hypothetical protein PG996_008711 [Apiospora saccharicola]|uniref:Uncharacterized protein n=1 Tax=Apiospora saccharicola TaxID=335842 RepID=A0ABR1UYP7_9PEZI
MFLTPSARTFPPKSRAKKRHMHMHSDKGFNGAASPAARAAATSSVVSWAQPQGQNHGTATTVYSGSTQVTSTQQGPVAAASTQEQDPEHGTKSKFTGLYPPFNQEGLSNSRWSKDRVDPAEGSSSMSPWTDHSGSAQASTRPGLTASTWRPQNRDANAAMFPSTDNSGSAQPLTQQSLIDYRDNLAESLAPILTPANNQSASRNEAVQGCNSFSQETEGNGNNVEEDANPAWLRKDEDVDAFSRSTAPFRSNTRTTDHFRFPSQQTPRQNRAAENVQVLSESTGSFDHNMGTTDPFGFGAQQTRQRPGTEDVHTVSRSTGTFGSNVGISDTFGFPSQTSRHHRDAENVQAFSDSTGRFGNNAGTTDPFSFPAQQSHQPRDAGFGTTNPFGSPSPRQSQQHQVAETVEPTSESNDDLFGSNVGVDNPFGFSSQQPGQDPSQGFW